MEPGALLHATSVAVVGRGVLIRGASGSGKSSLALQLMALGATLIADDQTMITLSNGAVLLDSPETIKGRIEARGVGLLRAPCAEATPAALIVDMDGPAPPRLPPRETADLLGVELPLIRGKTSPVLAAAIHVYMTHGRAD